MAKYYVNENAQTNGDHEVHSNGCAWLPAAQNRKHLGNFSDCGPAVRKAKQYFSQVNGCYYCSRSCHKT